MKFKEFKNVLPKVNNIQRSAKESHLKMAPSYRESLLKMNPEAFSSARKAAVMALFYPDNNDDTKLMLILRKTYKGVHSAQVSFPGGKEDPEDIDFKMTALRETYEEVGVKQHTVTVVSAISGVYIPPSNFYVHPFIGYTPNLPNFIKEEKEVEELLEIPLIEILNDANVSSKMVHFKGDNVSVPAFKLNGHLVWGATAMILSEIKDLLNAVL